METRKSVVEYIPPIKQTNTAGVVGAALGGTALLGVAGNAIGNLFRNPAVAPTMLAPTAAPVVVAPNVVPFHGGYEHGHGHGHGHDCHVTKYELGLVREMSAKDAEIGQLKAEKYADNAVKEAVNKVTDKYDAQIAALTNRTCNLETFAAVTNTGFEDYKQFSNRVFVHQPIARMKECIVTTQDNCCCCAPAQPA